MCDFFSVCVRVLLFFIKEISIHKNNSLSYSALYINNDNNDGDKPCKQRKGGGERESSTRTTCCQISELGHIEVTTFRNY